MFSSFHLHQKRNSGFSGICQVLNFPVSMLKIQLEMLGMHLLIGLCVYK